MTDLSAWQGVAVTLAGGLPVGEDRLHELVRRGVSDVELADALKFLVAASIVLPLLPRSPIGPSTQESHLTGTDRTVGRQSNIRSHCLRRCCSPR